MDQNPANNEYQSIIDKYKQSISTSLLPKIELLNPVVPTPNTPNVAALPDSPHPALAHAANFFKLTTIASFILFCLVFGKIFYNLYRYQNIKIPMNNSSLPTTPIIPTATAALVPVCTLNDQAYQLGQSFLAADGCNTCSCQSDGSIVCTQMSCPTITATPSIKGKK